MAATSQVMSSFSDSTVPTFSGNRHKWTSFATRFTAHLLPMAPLNILFNSASRIHEPEYKGSTRNKEQLTVADRSLYGLLIRALPDSTVGVKVFSFSDGFFFRDKQSRQGT